MEQETRLFVQVPVAIIESQELNDIEKLIFGEVYTMYNVTGAVFPTNARLAKRYGKSKDTISRVINSLRDKGFVNVDFTYLESGEVDKRFITPANNAMGIGKLAEGVTANLQRGTRKNDEDNRILNKSINRSVNNQAPKGALSGTPDDAPQKEADKIQYKQIIDYLNDKANKRFRVTDKYKKLIKARVNEGATLDDFKKVIDNMVANWSHDAKMQEYLRPVTLFGNKFDGYLNMVPKQQAANRPNWDDENFDPFAGGNTPNFNGHGGY